MNATSFQSECEILEWRDELRQQLSQSLDKELTYFLASLDKVIDELSISGLLSYRSTHKQIIAPKIDTFLETQREEIQSQIAVELQKSLQTTEGTETENVARATSELIVAGMAALVTLAPIAAVPWMIGAATVTGTAFLVIPTATISLPILATLVAGGLAVAGSSGWAHRFMVSKAKTRLKKNLHNDIFKRTTNIDDSTTVSLLAQAYQLVDQITYERMDKLEQ